MWLVNLEIQADVTRRHDLGGQVRQQAAELVLLAGIGGGDEEPGHSPGGASIAVRWMVNSCRMPAAARSTI